MPQPATARPRAPQGGATRPSPPAPAKRAPGARGERPGTQAWFVERTIATVWVEMPRGREAQRVGIVRGGLPRRGGAGRLRLHYIDDRGEYLPEACGELKTFGAPKGGLLNRLYTAWVIFVGRTFQFPLEKDRLRFEELYGVRLPIETIEVLRHPQKLIAAATRTVQVFVAMVILVSIHGELSAPDGQNG